MQDYKLVAIVTILALILYFMMGALVSRARGQFKIEAPATSGHPDFDRAFRIHVNTMEWLPLFLVSMWLFALYWNQIFAAVVGVIWIVGRILYMTGYSKAAAARGPGFGIQAAATGVLLFGALGRIIYLAITTHNYL